MPHVSINGINIYYEEQGEGDPLVLISGMGFPLDLWFVQIRELSKDFRVITPDNRGIGQSDKPNEEYSIAMMAAETVGLLKTLGIAKAHVAGMSMGGFISQEIALSYPSMVNRLILIATCMGGKRSLLLGQPFWDKMETALQDLSHRYENTESQDLWRRQMYRTDLTLMASPVFVQNHPDILDQAVSLRMKNVQPFHAFVRQFNACNSFDITNRAQNITQPTLIILGKDDPIFPIPLADDFKQKIPHAKMITYPDCGHVINLEKGDQLSCDMREFLRA